MPRILLTHPPHTFDRYFGEAALDALSRLGDVRRHHSAEPLGAHALTEQARGCQFILSDRATEGRAQVFARLPELIAFVRCAVDIRTIDVPAASANGVLVTHASAGFVQAVTEWVLGAMLDLARGITRSSEIYHRGATPTADMGMQLHGATLGIVGLGAIGLALARLANTLGMTVLGHDPYVAPTHAAIKNVELSALLPEADFVVCLAVANEQTENLFDAAAFAQMKRSACFINASRGNLVDEAALASALSQGRLAGAALDVGRAPDQTPSPELAAMDSVIATPHVGGLTPQAVAHQAFETVAQISALICGQIPAGAVNTPYATRLSRLQSTTPDQ